MSYGAERWRCATCKSRSCLCDGAMKAAEPSQDMVVLAPGGMVEVAGPLEDAEIHVCQVCHRAACICVSHARLTPLQREAAAQAVLEEEVPLTELDAKVREALHFYYNRDAQGLEKWVRRSMQWRHVAA